MDDGIPWAALVPVIVVAVGFVAFCLVDIARHEVRHLPKWLWALICLLSVPLGGIVYLLVGRGPEEPS
ncbi:MAG: PLD nuclease N-terminal domain-containing protein [Acidimicrobiia bacterium]